MTADTIVQAQRPARRAVRPGRRSLDVMVGLPLAPRGPAYTAMRLTEAMHGDELDCRIFAPLNRWDKGPPPLPIRTSAIGGVPVVNRLLYRLDSGLVKRAAEDELLRRLRRDRAPAMVYTFSEVSLRFSERLHELGVKVVREKTNCGKRAAREILDTAYAKLGLKPTHAITDAMIAKEEAELGLADAVFCPSPMVTRTLLDIGLPPERLLDTSYGWEPDRFAGDDRALDPIDGVTLIFLGYVCVRKGAHILLDAWKRANIKGRLVLVGDIEPAISRLYADTLARSDVLTLGRRSDVAALYRSADWFIFPTLEEGGPQVTYEAASTGLPLLVSPMGAGAFARDGQEGLIVESDDPDVWASAIASLPRRTEEAKLFGRNSRARACEFTWDRVGARRRRQLLKLAQEQWATPD